MGAKEGGEPSFSRLLGVCTASISDTLSLFKEPAPCGGKKVEWKEVITAAEGVAKHATTAGVLWRGKVLKKDGMDNIRSFTRALQGFLLLCHGSTVGAGSTLLTYVDVASKQVANASLNLLRGAVALSGMENNTNEVDLPVLVGCVWEACEAVKKTPSRNHVAIGRSLTQVAVSVKDVLRELSDFKQESVSKGAIDGATAVGESDTAERGDTQDDCLHGIEGEASSSDESTEFTDKLSAGEMQVVQSVREFISLLLRLLKQLLYITADISKASKDAAEDATPTLEKLLELSKDLGVGVDELGASLYPPQEVENLQARVAEMEGLIESMQVAVLSLNGSIPEDFGLALNASKDAGVSLKKVLEASSSNAA